jgi:predicted GIY-YIG superfamily endonuclease
MQKTLYTIYMLVDPRDHKPFYIGQTANIKARYYRQHWNPKDTDKSDRAERLRAILKAGRKPDLVILERTTRKVSALMREMFWIELFKSRGVTLKNQENQRWVLERYDSLMKQIRSKPARVKQP